MMYLATVTSSLMELPVKVNVNIKVHEQKWSLTKQYNAYKYNLILKPSLFSSLVH